MPQAPSVTATHQWRSFWVAAAVAVLTILDLSKVNVALPSVEAAFGASSNELQLIVSGYVLTFGLALVPMGRLGDQRSRRNLFLIGLVAFTATSIACAVATSMTTLLVARLIQGVAAGIQMPQVVGTVQEVFTGPERGKAFGYFGSTIGVATAFGPTLGGLMIAIGGASDGWRWVFWMNVPIAIAVMAAVFWLLPDRPRPPGTQVSLDPVGVVLFGLTVTAVMAPFLLTSGTESDDPRRWWILPLAAGFAIAFVGWERHYAATGRAPLIPLQLFGLSSFRNGTLIVSSYFSAIPAMFLTTTLFLQLGVGVAPVYAGMVSIGFALLSAISASYGGSRVDRYGRGMVIVGLVIVLIGTVVLAAVAHIVPAGAVEWVMAVVLAVIGLGGGLVVAPNQALTLAEVPVNEGGLGGSVGQLGQRIGTAVGTAVALSVFYSTVNSGGGSAAADLPVFRDAYQHALTAISGFIVVALALAILDAFARRRAR